MSCRYTLAWVRNTFVAMGKFAEQIFEQSLQGAQASAGHSTIDDSGKLITST